MGGCASKPKDLNYPPASLPGENSTRDEPTATKVEDKTITQENNNGGENQNEEPLVDLSEPTPKDPNTDVDVPDESKNVVADLVSEMGNPSDSDHVNATQTEENVGVGNETTEQIKDEAELVEKTDKTQKSDDVDNDQLLNSASSVDKVDSHLSSA